MSAIGWVEAEWNDGGAARGSGVMISPYHMLTAAHVVYDEVTGELADHVSVTPGKDGDLEPFGVAGAAFIRIDSAYADTLASSHDYALITLDRRIGDLTGAFGYTVYGSASFQGMAVRSAGYPADLRRGRVMYVQSGKTTSAAGGVIYSRLDIAAGQSGSPVYVMDTRGPYMVGMLVASTRWSAEAIHITKRVARNLSRWMAQDEMVRAPQAATRAMVMAQRHDESYARRTVKVSSLCGGPHGDIEGSLRNDALAQHGHGRGRPCYGVRPCDPGPPAAGTATEREREPLFLRASGRSTVLAGLFSIDGTVWN